jgi:UDP-glucose 4-epimerase
LKEGLHELNQQTCFVTGATGVVGPVLVRDLLERGYKVRALVRRPIADDELPREVEIFQGDLLDKEILKEAIEGVDIVFHLAAKLHINNPAPSLKEEYKRVNVSGTESLLEIAQSVSLKRFVYFSSIAVYGKSKPREDLITEVDEVSPDALYAETKYEGERIVLDDESGVVLRLAAVYGKGMKGNYPRLVNALKRRRYLHIGKGTNRRTLVHVRDVSRAAIVAAENPVAVGKIYNVTDGTVYSIKEIIETICKVLEIAPPKFHLPERPARIMAGVFEDAFALIKKRAPVNRATIDKLLEDIAVSGDKIKTELGFQPQYDLLKGWKEALDR